MNNFAIILVAVAVVTLLMLHFGTKNAQEIKEEELDIPVTKFQPRKVTHVTKEEEVEPVVPAPKKKYYRKNYKKKPIDGDKKSVGRPKKSE